jgi:hypothetical protein
MNRKKQKRNSSPQKSGDWRFDMCNARPSSLKNVNQAVRQVRAAMHPFNLRDVPPTGSPLTEKNWKMNLKDLK